MAEENFVGKRILETLTTSLYEDPITIFREYVQNALDSKIRAEDEGRDIDEFEVKIDIDRDNKTIIISDNGLGIPSKEFKRKMKDLSRSDKTKDYIGFRGIGRLSALPLCEKLVFESKYEGEDVTNSCTFDAVEYKRILDEEGDKGVLALIDEITSFEEENHANKGAHFFRVTINGYSSEIEIIVDSESFTKNLKVLLPLRYSKSFSNSKMIILEKYREFTGTDLERYMCPIYYNGTLLEKEYADADIGASGIHFWKLQGKEDSNVGKLGIMWFTFNHKIEANPRWKKKSIDGIFLRSKNVLMGTKSIFADQASKTAVPFSTYQEMSAALLGVSGELLIYSDKLEDNARRDWFKMSPESAFLRIYMHTFLETLHKYRYAISRYYRKNGEEESFNKAKECLRELLEKNPEDAISTLIAQHRTRSKKVKAKDRSDENGKEESRPDESGEEPFSPDYHKDLGERYKQYLPFYTELMTVVENFMKNESQFILFNKLRNHIRQRFKDEDDGKDPAG